ncbi:MAG: molecular chaperone [Hydrogenophaga sp.]|uniref:fimbrial biogenesis chaperone n=1 Tax=Hydrogenophaga sp. TaxID=1904254 RepID=UPI003D0F6932
MNSPAPLRALAFAVRTLWIRSRWLGLALLACQPAWVPVAQAGSFAVAPVYIYMTPRERVVAVKLANSGETEVALQADLYTWSQSADGVDSLVPTEDLILAPSIIRLAPKSQQVVRLALLRPADLQRQLTYRLIVREVPEVFQQKDNTIQLPVALALSMPVYVTPPGAKRLLECEVQRPTAQTLGVQCANKGTAHAQVRAVILRHNETELARFAGGAYILPGASRFVPMEAAAGATPGTAAQLDVRFGDGTRQSRDVTLP